MPNYVVVLEGYIPGARLDGVPWNRIRIEEAAPESADGPYTSIDTQALSPLDSDPAEPQSRDFTTTEATLPEGWYRVVFLDENDAEQAAEPEFFPGSSGLEPTVREVAALLSARTVDEDGNETGTFDEDTRPTGSEARQLIEQAVTEIEGRLGSAASFPNARLVRAARSIAALMAAMNIELTYFPEQVESNKSAYTAYERRVTAALGTPKTPGWLVVALTETPPGEDSIAEEALPLFNFDSPYASGELTWDPATETWILRAPPPPSADEGSVSGVWPV